MEEHKKQPNNETNESSWMNRFNMLFWGAHSTQPPLDESKDREMEISKGLQDVEKLSTIPMQKTVSPSEGRARRNIDAQKENRGTIQSKESIRSKNSLNENKFNMDSFISILSKPPLHANQLGNVPPGAAQGFQVEERKKMKLLGMKPPSDKMQRAKINSYKNSHRVYDRKIGKVSAQK